MSLNQSIANASYTGTTFHRFFTFLIAKDILLIAQKAAQT
jgi:hypothetical protein